MKPKQHFCYFTGCRNKVKHEGLFCKRWHEPLAVKHQISIEEFRNLIKSAEVLK